VAHCDSLQIAFASFHPVLARRLARVNAKVLTLPEGRWAGTLSAPRIINLITDPQESEDIALPCIHSWTMAHFKQILGEFKASTQRESLIPSGAPLGFVPSAKREIAETELSQWLRPPYARCSETRCGWLRCRSPQAGGRRAGSAGSSSARRGASRP